MSHAFQVLLAIGVLYLAEAASSCAGVTLNYQKTDLKMVYPLNLIMTVAAGETGYYDYNTAGGTVSGSFTSTSPKTIQVNPRADDWVIHYHSVSSGGVTSPTSTATYHVYDTDATIPDAEYTLLTSQGIVKNRNIIDESYQSTVMAPPDTVNFDPCMVGYNIYLPEDYYTNTDQSKLYPVIYFFHGGGGNENAFLDDLYRVHQAIASHTINPLIVVMVHGGEPTWFIHDAPPITPKAMMESTFLNELLPAVEAKYRVRSDAGGRALMGFSMGGFGALKFGFSQGTAVFSSTVGFSAGLEGQDAGMSDTLKTDIMTYLNTLGYGLGDISAVHHEHEIYYWFEKNRLDIAKMGVYLTVGNPSKGELSNIYNNVYNGSGSLTKKFDAYGMPYLFHYSPNTGHGIPWGVVGNEPFTFIQGKFTPGFDAWRAANFNAADLANPAVSGPAACPAQDGFPNLLKYALDAAALDAVSLKLIVGANNLWTYAFTRNGKATDVDLHIDSSPDTVNWTEVAFSTAGGPLQGVNGTTVLYDTPDTVKGSKVRLTLKSDTAPQAVIRFRADAR